MSIYTKLLELQKKIQPVLKEKENTFFNNSKYFDVNAVVAMLRPALNEAGLVLLQPLTMVGDRRAIRTILIDAETGEKLEDTLILPALEDAQKIGASVTYFRRFSISSLLLLEGEVDDDGNTASGKVASPVNSTKPIAKVAKPVVTQPTPEVDVDELPF